MRKLCQICLQMITKAFRHKISTFKSTWLVRLNNNKWVKMIPELKDFKTNGTKTSSTKDMTYFQKSIISTSFC